jgi:glycosyltransferase involved in cell wall biosynthesis
MPLADNPQHQALMREAIARSPLEQKLACLKLQGPYSTPLLEYLAAHHQDYDLVTFFTYLYPTTFFGSRQVPAAKTVLIPTAHDEAPIYFPVFQEMFARFPTYVFLTPEERCLIEETFNVNGALKATIGMPVELSSRPDPLRFREGYGINGPFVLYAGRLDPSKGCDELLRFFWAARRHLPPDLKLVLIGDHVIDIPRDANIRYLGMLSEQDKVDAMAAATVVVNPSPFESFSIAVLEAMLCGTPVLVNGRSKVLKGHIQRSSAGLYYETYYEFVEIMQLLLADATMRSHMGTNGLEYVKRNYQYNTVKQRYIALFDRIEAVI